MEESDMKITGMIEQDVRGVGLGWVTPCSLKNKMKK